MWDACDYFSYLSTHKDDVTVNDALTSSEETKTNSPSTNSNNNNNSNVSTNEISPPEMDIVVGNRLQPMLKERTPHKLFVNRPQNINSQVRERERFQKY